jgi:hypothetical protein
MICVDICGDGYAIDNPCDIPFRQLNTGCSDTCQIKADFTCLSSPISYSGLNGSTVTVKKTDCIHTGLTYAKSVGCQQLIFGNRMRLEFEIYPYLNGMPLPSDSLSYISQIFILESSIPITI